MVFPFKLFSTLTEQCIGLTQIAQQMTKVTHEYLICINCIFAKRYCIKLNNLPHVWQSITSKPLVFNQTNIWT